MKEPVLQKPCNFFASISRKTTD